MTRRKQGQRVLWEGMIDEDVRALWEPWMVQADRLQDDEELIDRVYVAQGERHEHSATRGRSQTPAEMVLRLMLLKHAFEPAAEMAAPLSQISNPMCTG